MIRRRLSAPLSLRDRLTDALASYLPLLLMALLALGSWWLVSQTPHDEEPSSIAPLRHVADYSMRGFHVQRFAADGRLSGQIAGDAMRHFPDNDTMEIDNPRVRSIGADGIVTEATARQALSMDDGNRIELTGDARVVRQGVAGQPAIEFRGEHLHADLVTERIHSTLPVSLTQGGARWTAKSFEYDHAAQRVELRGELHAVFPARPADGR